MTSACDRFLKNPWYGRGMKAMPRNTTPAEKLTISDAEYAENVLRTVDLTDSDSLMNW